MYVHHEMNDEEAENKLKAFAPDLYNGRYVLRKVSVFVHLMTMCSADDVGCRRAKSTTTSCRCT